MGGTWLWLGLPGSLSSSFYVVNKVNLFVILVNSLTVLTVFFAFASCKWLIVIFGNTLFLFVFGKPSWSHEM